MVAKNVPDNDARKMSVVSLPAESTTKQAASRADAIGLDPALIGFFDSCTEAVCITNGDLADGPRILYVNAAYTTLTGWPHDAIIGETPRRLQGPRSDRARLSELKEALQAGRSWRGEVVNYRRDGSEFVMAWSITSARAVDGTLRYIAFQRDVTDHHVAREVLARRERQMVSAQRIARMGDWEYCGLRRLLTISETVAEILRLPPGQTSLSLEEFVRRLGDHDKEAVKTAFVDASVNHGPISLECQFFPSAGARPVHLRVEGAFADPHETGFATGVGMISDVSEQAEKTAKLADRAKRLELAQHTARLGHWTLCPRTRRLRLSSNAARIIGLDPDKDEAHGFTLARWRERIPADDRETVSGISAKMTEPLSVTYRLNRPNGETIWVRTVAEPELDKSGKPVTIRGLHQDVTALIEAQEAERQAYAMLREALDHAPDAILLLDSERRVAAFNQALLDMYPRSSAAIKVGAPFDAVVRATVDKGEYHIAGSRERWIEDRLERLTNPPERGWTQRMRDGRVVEILERRTASGGYVSLRRDVTETRKTHDLLERRQKAIEASADGIAITCSEGRFTFVNPAWAAQLGISREEMLGRHWRSFYDAGEIDVQWPVVTRTLRDYGRWRGELTAIHANGEGVAHEVSLTELEDSTLIAVSRDISERKTAEREKEQLQHQFHEAQKMEAMGMMAGGIAHDFNNLLSSILGYAGFLQEDLEDGSQPQSYADQIIEAGNRAKQLIGQILAFSRRQTGERAPCDLRRVLNENVELLRASLTTTITLTETVPDQAVLVEGNAVELGQVVMNLGVNARDACANGHGTVALSLSTGYPEDYLLDEDGAAPDTGSLIAGLRVSATSNGRVRASLGDLPEGCSVAVLSVADDGCGMDAETLKRAFEPFFTTKGQQRGTGLGLAAVYGIVSAHGGAMAVETRPGQGCRFHILLPLLLHESAGAPTKRSAPKRGNGRIVVVDDEPMVRETTAVALERLGYTVESFAAASPVLKRLREGGQPVDLIISDQTMPGMTGTELAQAIRDDGFTVPVVLCSGFDSRLEQNDLSDFAVTDFQQKPIDIAELSEKVQIILDRQP